MDAKGETMRKTTYRIKTWMLFLLLPIGVLAAVASPRAIAGLTTQDLNTTTPDQLASLFAGPGVAISNVRHTGALISAGTFAGGADAAGGTAAIGISGGVILSSGNIVNVVGPNVAGSTSTSLGVPGDPDLDVLAGGPTNDATVLEFDFVPSGGQVFFQYLFASEEYNEFVGSQFNDVFGFFINGVNCATVGVVPVSVNTINNGNPFGSGGPNSILYQNNDVASGAPINTEMDGLTVVLSCQAVVTPNVVNHAKLAIADTSDESFDSNVLLRAGSVTTTPPVEAKVENPNVPIVCNKKNCRPRITCAFAPSSGGSCSNDIRVFVAASAAKSSDTALARAKKPIRFAFGVGNVPPGQTQLVALRLTNAGKKIVKAKKGKRLRAVMEIRNVAGTGVEVTNIKLKLK
ncbi:MAG: choice-of-anchor L domain-containing protein [Gammaproteobacteria bacterium]